MPVRPPAPLTTARLLRRTLRRHRGRLAGGVALLSLHQAAEAAVPLAIGLIVEQAVATGELSALVWSVVGLAALFTVLTFAWRFGARLTEAAIHSETHQLRVEVAARALDPRGHRSGLRSGELLAIAAADAERTALIIRASTVAVAALAALAVASVVLLTIDVALGLGVLLGVPALVTALQALAPVVTRRTADQQAAAGATTALATDLVTGLRALRGLGAVDNAARRYRDSSRHTLAVTLRATTMSGVYQGITAGASGLFLAAVAGVAGWMAIRGRISIGEFITVVGLAQFVAEPVRALGFCGQLAAAVWASAGRVARVLTASPAVVPGQRTPARPARVRLALAGVSYRSLRDVDLRLHAGELLAVVAHEPRDAEALLDLLRGRVPADDHRGTVTVDAVPVSDLSIDALRTQVLVEPHDTALFEGTLRSNLLVHSAGPGPAAVPADAADPRLAAAITAACADDIVGLHPGGLDHPVTDRGASLSGGQRQRIGLARALVADPPILVLHDPTTAVDAATEQRLAAGLRAARHGPDRPDDPAAPATLVVTSSPTLLAQADRVLVLAAGQVVGSGSHQDLARTDESYRAAVLR
ncbi:ABC transporter ATP-binding protein [Solwaraspora sp. WMMA2056]|uniref:ABC transporter ATP-binding protein n=1 Tax=Solwaraspora sp. WMMA2056 TaxID=3015161 RepID=UPI00259B18CD|nr:ABC transporter ATP-binding protein [Solwaraspora sp. WMMA2056]WJK38814.1 ABC transporter ATP-binding protein [Solwaraspora sp. WMMA2056]